MQLTIAQSEKIATSAFLVTGGAGFIGSHIAECLLIAGARKVRVLDNMSTGHFRNVASFVNHPRFEYRKGDVRDVDTCKAACKGMDYVFHEAALESGPESINNDVAVNNGHVSGFLNLLLIAQAAGVKRFIYASGFPVYGDNHQPYAVSKYINELYADVFARQYGMETIGLRYFHVFGQRQDPQSPYAAVIPKFVMQLVRHESPVIDGTGEYAYNFNYVENVVQANMLAVLTTDPQAINQVYNITFEERTSLHQLAEYLKELLGTFDESIAGIEVIDRSYPDNHARTPQLVACAEKAKKLLGYQPCFSLQLGLLKSAGWYWAYLPQFSAEASEKKLRSIEKETLSGLP